MKKAISPLIAAIFLIVFTIVVAGIIAAFFTTFTLRTTSQVEKKTFEIIDWLNEY